MKKFRTDLHVHTVLSPCASVEMIPPLIIQKCIEHNIDLIAITDHNAWENTAAVIDASNGYDVTVLPGIEITTIEEVHALCIFDDLSQIASFYKIISSHLPDIPNNPDIFGEQFIVDQTGLFIKRKSNLLAQSIQLSLSEISDLVFSHQGLFIPSHITRRDSGLLPLLGWVPDSLKVDALEIDRNVNIKNLIEKFPTISQYPLIQNGDVHHLDDFLGTEIFEMEKPCTNEIRRCLSFAHYNCRSLG
ncbi:MAG: PHP domain-containing protein [Anaerolineaceae bacterium]|nr:PHP domain-containing protein [Anaerolineaceae bacterium]